MGENLAKVRSVYNNTDETGKELEIENTAINISKFYDDFKRKRDSGELDNENQISVVIWESCLKFFLPGDHPDSVASIMQGDKDR